MPTDNLSLRGVTPVWVFVAIAAVVVLVATPADHQVQWLAIALAASTILTFAIQLSLDRTDGLVNRVAISLGGAFVILATATGIGALLAAL